jgi:DNA polymerase III epsilon subunit family exonuclease
VNILTTPLDLVSFVSIDVETTGLDPKRDEIVEVAGVKMQGGRVVDEFETLVYIDTTIPFSARRVNGISNEMLVGKPRIAQALRSLLAFAGDGTLVEHSREAFDIAFIERAYGSPLTVPYINTCTLSRHLFPFLPRHSLAECCKRFNIVNTNPHRALGDARATADLLRCLLEISAARYPRLEDLVRVASVQREERTHRQYRRRIRRW